MSYDFLNKNWLKVCIESPYVELMQFTGLTDRNRKEIYEGDIYSIDHPHKHRKAIGSIIYRGHRFTSLEFYFPHQDDPGDPFESVRYMEIIGNIYEHPHLLTGGTSDE
jgi:hypothetical protein